MVPEAIPRAPTAHLCSLNPYFEVICNMELGMVLRGKRWDVLRVVVWPYPFQPRKTQVTYRGKHGG